MKLPIEKAVYGGDGLGRGAGGRVVFVPFTIPGEVVEVSATEESGRSAKAELVHIDVASPDRVKAKCKHFGRCGGCQHQHADYALQIRIKTDILSETLERMGLRDRPQMTIHAANPWGYRNRIRLRVESVQGTIRFGYNLRDTREFLAIEECPIAAPVLWKTAQALLDLSKTEPMCAQWLRAAAEVELFTTPDEQSLQMTLMLRLERSARFVEFCEKVKLGVGEVVGVGVEIYGGGAKKRESAGWGKAGLRYVVEDKVYWVTRGSFFQVNRFLVGELVRVVTEGRKGLIAWDLFAGVGLFSRVLADSFERVSAVEANPLAMKDLQAAKVANLRGFAVSVVDYLREAVIGRERPDLVVMDPPRAGAGAEVCGLLARMQVPQIVYVSCDPTTLARDLRMMVDSGYNLAELHLVDLFPQTFHLETVAVLQR